MRKLEILLACYIVLFIFSNLLVNPAVEKQEVLPEVLEVFVEKPEVVVKLEEKPVLVVALNRISAYNPVPRQTWGDPNVSSCGPNLDKQIAVSRDLFFDEYGRKHLCGTPVTVITDRGETFEDYVIWDTMHPRYKNTADILIPTPDESLAIAFGITPGILILHVD